ncbi:dihydroorotate dehydrogenase-like protein [Saccharicrinis fermentans]|uniref:Dihydroorotate dehydrogenase B n=1 Tax=Saccharicrinis fermentans DSM 9555 = JCM 21142 TaxID=869213 RepID=W7XW56_9BACT|nr:dihydroorotate dehydrogenase-like protein [Saccharicrinis fermentans]GAF02505.1 dihydroorotate dehydrogenase B [Saccharicrinis fermentans DSM 9555 = JCM 21142]
MDLKTTYMGIELKNPIIVGASNLVTDVKMAQKLEEAGAAAIVFKSLFEEQIHLEAAELDEDLHEYDERNAEMTSLFPQIEHSGPKAHLMALKSVVDAVSIPVFASLNCLYDVSWVEYAKYLEETGIAGIELNFYPTISENQKSSVQIEQEQLEVLIKVKEALKIPVSVKLSPYYSNTLHVIRNFNDAKADAFVLFNRLFQPDIDIETEALKMPYNLSSKNDNRLSLRYAGLLSGNVKGSICANNGIHDAEDLISVLLAGADAVQIVSTIYKNGLIQVTTMLEDLSVWMKNKGYAKLEDFKGKLSKNSLKEPYAYKRAQYVDYLMKPKEFTKQFQI